MTVLERSPSRSRDQNGEKRGQSPHDEAGKERLPYDIEWLQKEFEARGLKFTHEVLLPLATGLNQPGIRAFFVEGPPGTGKTALAETLASILNARFIFFQCTLNSGEDEFLYKLVPDDKSPSGIRKILGPLPQAAISSRRKLTVLLVDEIDKARQSVDSLFLDFLQNGRISLYLDDKQTIIKAKPENLIVFMTTNNARELIEPLQRRLIRIVVKPLPAEVVFKLMTEQFNDKKLAALLTQIYQDTINAGLSKPATLPELRLLGHAIQLLGGLRNVDNNTFILLLRSYIIKNTEDEIVYFKYIHKTNRKPYQWLHDEVGGGNVDVLKKYAGELSAEKQEEERKKQREEERREKVKQKKETLEDMIKVKMPSDAIVPKIEVKSDEQKIVFAKIPMDNYNKVIKAFEILPQESPDDLIKFSVVKDEFDNTLKIIAHEPLDLMQFKTAEDNRISGEYFVEDVIAVDPNILYEYLRLHECCKITYWTKNRIVIKYIDKYNSEKHILVRFTNIGGDRWRVEVYANGPYFSEVHSLLRGLFVPHVYWPENDFEGYDDDKIVQVIDTVLEDLIKLKSSIENLSISKLNTPYAKYLQNNMLGRRYIEFRIRTFNNSTYGIKYSARLYTSNYILIVADKDLLDGIFEQYVDLRIETIDDINYIIEKLNNLKKRILTLSNSKKKELICRL